MAAIKFIRGVKANYQPTEAHKDAIFFATDTLEILVNGTAYGMSDTLLHTVVTGVSYSSAENKLNFTTGNGPVEVELPLAGTTDGLMSAADKAALDELIGGGSGSVQDQIQQATTALKETIDAYTVNGKAISTNPVINGGEIALDNYSKPSGGTSAVAAIDTVNAAIGKLELANENTQNALEDFMGTKGQAGGLASLDENGKIPSTQLNGQLAHVFGIDGVCLEAELASQSPEAGDIYYTTDTKKFYNYNGTSWDDPMDPAEDTIYNFRNCDVTGDTGRTNILYRWDGETLVEISESLAIGETVGTAYEGSKGKANKDALDSIPAKVITGFGAVTPSADNISIAVTDSNKDGATNQFSNGDGSSIVIPAATDTEAGAMSAADKEYIEAVKDAIGEDPSDLDVLTVSNAGIGILANYAVAAEAAAIAPTDTINQAIGKLEKTLNDLTGEGGEGSIQEQIQAAIDALKGDATEAGDTLGKLENRLETTEADIDQAQEDITGLKANTVNGYAISTDPVLNGADIVLTGYTAVEGGTVAATDTVNAAINKLESSLVWIELA